ncbi:MAG: hypothetical protein LBR33_07645 [Propionibacteriaceae bacterium]|jgi:hypothetical protein|nr:hypothetical protein [Propionibacteriaceae bacterium]
MTEPLGSVLLDSQGLSLLMTRNREFGARMARAKLRRLQVVVSALTIAEAGQGPGGRPALDYALSQISRVEPVTEADGKTAIALLRRAGLTGHTIDACLAALSLRLVHPTTVYTSDPGDWQRLVGDHVGLVTL